MLGLSPFEGFKEIKTLQKEQFFHQKVVENAKKYADKSIKSSLISMMPRYLIELALIIFIVFVVFINTKKYVLKKL